MKKCHIFAGRNETGIMKLSTTGLLKVIAVILVMFSSICARAEVKENDFAMWGSLTVRKHIVSGLSLSVNGEIRSANTVRDINLWWVNPELNFKFNDYFSLMAGYRFSQVNRTDHYEPGHRWYAGGTIGVGIGPVRLSLRELIEQIYYTDREKGSYGSVVSYLRSRLNVDLRFESLPFVPYAEVENFLYIIDYKKGTTGIMRYSAGVRIPVAKVNTFNVYYRCQQYFNDSPNDHILGLGYTLSF